MIAIGPLLVLLALLGAPLFVVIAASAIWGFTQEGIDLQAVVIEFYGMAEMPILLAIPLSLSSIYPISTLHALYDMAHPAGAVILVLLGIAVIVLTVLSRKEFR